MIYNPTIEELDSDLKVILEKSIGGVEKKLVGVEKSKVSGTAFEKEVCEILNKYSAGTQFNQKFEQASSHAFPDIFNKVLEKKWYGVEVKTSQSGWKCFGNSIFETTRIQNLDDRIYLFYGNFQNDLKCRWSKYEDSIETINITHSPRYHINMDIPIVKESSTVFEKMAISYNDFVNTDIETRMKFVREFKRGELGKNAALWWLPNTDILNESYDSNLKIKLLSSLSVHEKNMIRCKSIVLFPEIFDSNYENVLVWMASEFGVVTGSLRDLYSAGGKHSINYQGESLRIPRIYGHLESNIELIKKIISELTEFEIYNYWTKSSRPENFLNHWIKSVSNFSNNQKISNWISDIASR